MRTLTLTLIVVLLSTVFLRLVAAQPSPFGSVDGNVATWKWDKAQRQNTGDSEERESGDTAWERLDAERQTEEQESHSKETPTTLTPLQMWRMLRGQSGE
jgi:hypothetical protein